MSTQRYDANNYAYYEQIDVNSVTTELNVVPSRRLTSWVVPNSSIHTSTEGETFRHLSLMYYNTEAYWWLIADVNPKIDTYKGAFGLEANTLVTIPPRSAI